MVELDDIDLELLSDPFEGDFPAGAWLRFDSVFDEVKRARMSESDYLPQGIWQRETKRANWSQSLELSFEVLRSRSKDLQFAAWLTEALSHLHGLRGTIKGVELINRLSTKLWVDLYPNIDDDEDFTSRMLVLEWLDRTLPEAMDMVSVTSTGTEIVHDFSLRQWQEIKRVSQVDEGAAQTRRGRNKEQAPAGINIDDFWVSIKRTPGEFFADLSAQIHQLEAVLVDAASTFAEICGPGSVRFPKLNTSITVMKKCLSEIERYRHENSLDSTHQDEPSLTEVEAQAGISSDAGVGQLPTSVRIPVDIIGEIKRVSDRDQAYKILESLAERIVEIDPHSAAPYLARKAASFKNYSFAELMLELVDDERMRKHLFKLMGMEENIGGSGIKKNEIK